MNNAILDQVEGQLRAARSPMIVCHIRPDGDAIGSLLGLGLSLQAAGISAQMVSVDGVPSTYRFLQGYEQILTKPRVQPDYVIVVDCSEISRIGNISKIKLPPDVNIDHHITNDNFAKFNLVDSNAVATAEILVKLIERWNLPLNQDIAAALLTGLLTDTLGFRTANITPNALRLAADLMDKGADLSTIYQQTLIQRSFEAMLYWATGLNKLQRIDGIVWTSLTLKDRAASNYPGRDDADLINVLSSISGVDVAILFVQQAVDRVKISWRARDGINISQIALQFGGGGHPAAAGAELQGNLDEICQQVLHATQTIYQNELTKQAPNSGSMMFSNELQY